VSQCPVFIPSGGDPATQAVGLALSQFQQYVNSGVNIANILATGALSSGRLTVPVAPTVSLYIRGDNIWTLATHDTSNFSITLKHIGPGASVSQIDSISAIAVSGTTITLTSNKFGVDTHGHLSSASPVGTASHTTTLTGATVSAITNLTVSGSSGTLTNQILTVLATGSISTSLLTFSSGSTATVGAVIVYNYTGATETITVSASGQNFSPSYTIQAADTVSGTILHVSIAGDMSNNLDDGEIVQFALYIGSTVQTSVFLTNWSGYFSGSSVSSEFQWRLDFDMNTTGYVSGKLLYDSLPSVFLPHIPGGVSTNIGSLSSFGASHIIQLRVAPYTSGNAIGNQVRLVQMSIERVTK